MEATNDVNGVNVVGEREGFNESLAPHIEVERIPVMAECEDFLCPGCLKHFKGANGLEVHWRRSATCPQAIEKRVEQEKKNQAGENNNNNNNNNNTDVRTEDSEWAKNLATREARKVLQDALSNTPERLEELIEEDEERAESFRAYALLLIKYMPTLDLIKNVLPLLPESVWEELDAEDANGFADAYAPLASKISVDDAQRKKQVSGAFGKTLDACKREPMNEEEVKDLQNRLSALASRDFVPDGVPADIGESELLMRIKTKRNMLINLKKLIFRALIDLGADYKPFQNLYMQNKVAGKGSESEIEWRKIKLGLEDDEGDDFVRNVFPTAGLCYLLSCDFPMLRYAAIGKTFLVKNRKKLREYFTAKTDEGARRRRMWFGPENLSDEQKAIYDATEKRYMAGDIDPFILGKKDESRRALAEVECEFSNSDEDEVGPVDAGGVSSNSIDSVGGVVDLSNIVDEAEAQEPVQKKVDVKKKKKAVKRTHDGD